MLHIKPDTMKRTCLPADDSGNQDLDSLLQRLNAVESELAETRRQFSHFLHNLPGMVYRCGLDAPWTMSFVSKGIETLTGYPPETLEQGKSWAEIIHPDDIAAVEEEVAAAIPEHRSFLLSYRIVTREGDVRWVQEQGQAVYDDAGKPQFLEGVISGITEQKLLELDLREAKQNAQLRARLLSEALEAATDCVYTLDSNWRITYLNSRAKEYFSADEDLIGKPITDIFPDSTSSVFRDHFISAMQDGVAASLEGFLSSTGSWYELTVTPAEDGITIFFRDISTRKEAEAAQQRGSDRLRTILNSVPKMLWSVQADGGEEYYNQQWIDFTGIDVGQPDAPARIDLVHPDDRERAVGAWEASLRTGLPYDIQYRLRHHSDEYRWIHSGANAVLDASGKPTGWYGACTDIHDRTLAEEALNASEKRFREILDSMPQIVWSIAADGHHPDYYNLRWYEFSGLPVGSTEGPEWDDLYHPDDKERALAKWRHSRATGEPYEVEYRLRHRTDGYRWVESRACAERGADGTIRRWYGTCTDIHQRVLAREALNQSELRVQTILDSIPHIIWSADAEGRLDYLSNQWKEFYDTSDVPFAGEGWLQALYPGDIERAALAWRRSVATGDPYEMEFRVITASGKPNWILARARPERNQAGEIVRWYGTYTDIHQQVVTQQALKESESVSRGILEASPDCVALLDIDGTVLYVNEATMRAHGASDPAELIGSEWGSTYPASSRMRIEEALSRAQNGEIGRVMLQLGTKLWWDVVVAPINDHEGAPLRLVVVARDMTDQKDAEERAQWAANHDSLTHLPNRFLLQKRIDDAIERSVDTGEQFALLLLDLDDFKRVNDTIGHDAGDSLLCEFGERLSSAVRPEDSVARLGGDEFAVILNGVRTSEDVDAAVRTIFETFQKPCVYAGRMLDCHASIGASMFPSHGTDRIDLLKNADVALYAAKAGGGANLKIFEPEMRHAMQKRSSMLALAKDALKQDRIIPYYQPKIDLCTGAVAGFEALLRWQHPQRGIQQPDTVAAAFEDLNLAAEISDRMIAGVIGDIQTWRDRGVKFGHVAVNASAAEFRRGDFAERLLERLADASIPPACIQVEVTETVFLGRGSEYVERALKVLSAAGVKIALDDFGTGYASLSHLKQFPVDIIKIDRSFVGELEEGSGDAAIIDAVVNLGRSLGIGIVAEGIETPFQHDFLLELGCDFGQGFLYEKALPSGQVPALIQSFDSSLGGRGSYGQREGTRLTLRS